MRDVQRFEQSDGGGGARRLSRRGVLRAGAGVVAVGALGGAGAVARPRAARAAAGAVFDLATPAEALLSNVGLHHRRTIMQCIAVDSRARRMYVAQVVQAGTALPGDAPGDEVYEERVRRGDLTLTRLRLDGTEDGHMFLKGFGHGVSIGFEPGGGLFGGGFVWAEIDAVTEGTTGWGTRLVRFPFRDGSVIDAARTPGLQRRELLPGVDRTTASVDPVHRRLVMRYRRAGVFRFAVFDLDEVAAPQGPYTPLFDVAQPDALAGVTFQGYTVFDESLYLLDGTIYGDANPPGSGGNTHLTRVSLVSGKVEQRVLSAAGAQMHRREPEGMAVHLADADDASSAGLCFGFGTSLSADPDEDRLATVFRIGL